MADHYEHTTRTRAPTAGEKVGSSLGGLCCGPVVVLLGCLLLFYNEGVAIKTHRSLNEALDAYKSTPATQVRGGLEGHLIHTSHMLSVDSNVQDSTFGISRPSVSLSRYVETYQWVEDHQTHERKLDNGETETRHTYDYRREWKEGITDSSTFEHPEGHRNPSGGPYSSETFRGPAPRLGDLTLSSELSSQLTQTSTVNLRSARPDVPQGGEIQGNLIYFRGLAGSGDDRHEHRRIDDNRRHNDRRIDDSRRRQQHNQHAGSLADEIETSVQRMDGEDKIIYKVKRTGETFSSRTRAEDAARRATGGPARRLLHGGPRVGDVRVSWKEVPCSEVTVLAKLRGSELVSWPSAQGSGYDIGMVSYGRVSAEEMITDAQSANTIWTWVKRFVGWLLCLIGFSMITSIVSTMSHITLDWIPLLGGMATSIIDLGVSIANFVLASSLSFVVAAFAWIWYRPLLGGTMLACGLGLFYMSSQAGSKKRTAVVKDAKR